MKKVVRDDKVALILTESYGGGWFSWHGSQSALHDPELVEWIEAGKPEEDLDYFVNKYPEHSLSTLGELRLQWVPMGERFVIDEYDGWESVVLESNMRWMVA